MALQPTLQPILHDPDAAPPVDTSPEALGMDVDSAKAVTGKRSVRLSSSFGGIGRNKSGRTPPSSPPASETKSPRRLFSLSRKGKGKSSERGDNEPSSPSSTPGASRPTSPLPNDDSPFNSPPSPPSANPRSLWSSFRGDGSMRVGTQTLIQALQAIPWTKDPDNDDEIMNHGGTNQASEDESEDDDRPSQSPPHMASSIHTIYRPIARLRRSTARDQRWNGLSSHPEDPLSGLTSEDEDHATRSEDEADDFEMATPRPAATPTAAAAPSIALSRSLRQGSMATVRLQRRAMLAEKLREIFELDDIEEVRAEMPCWLLRSILLQGYVYLTNSYLCFFAHMPSKEDQVLKSGSLSKKASRTKRWIKHWFILKNDALSWYQSSSDPYFPHGIVDLRYAISCEPSGDKQFRIRTNQKTVSLYADSTPSRDEWVKAIRKVVLKAQNMGDSVKIAIPYDAILDVDKSSAMDFSETIEIKVLDKEESDAFSMDFYFFAYFHDLPAALDQIREVVRTHRATQRDSSSTPRAVLDSTAPRAVIPSTSAPAITDVNYAKPSPSTFRISSLLRPFSERPVAQVSEPPPDLHEEFTHINTRSSSFVPTTESPVEDEEMTPRAGNQEYHHTYPPSTSLTSTLDPDIPSLTRREASSSWNVGVPGWLRGGRTSRLFGSYVTKPVKEIYSTTSSSVSGSRWSSVGGDMAVSVLDNPPVDIDPEIVDKFHTSFAYDDKERLLGYFPGYIFRLLPVYGRLFISTNHFCFKSSGPLTSRTRMALPIRDILSTEKSKATRFGHHGLIIIVRGHEELFFEFSAEDKREAFVALLERQMDDVRGRVASGDLPSQGKFDALVVEEFESPSEEIDDNMTDSLPPVMFTSTSSTFLTFKPQKSLHFTFLTIGSRGDVQPYIALAKGLKADGHRVRIATHGEFKEWVESHDIEFRNIGGDPAELIRICVDNGMFTLSFVKDGLNLFRGWLDDLLKTSWEACQGTDVLIESPSAMGGVHIAEGLGIPYFRAFTMTWSRTRAYPHAFAVPERKMGGSYNYMSYVMFDQVFWRATAGQINRWRRNILHLESTSLDKMEPHKIPFLYNFSPSVVPPPLDWPEWIRITGYWFLDDAEVSADKWTPPEDLVAFIDNAHALGKKVVYIGFGSMVVSDPKAMTRCVIEAIVQSGVYAILSKGWSDRLHVKSMEASEVEEPLPKQIYAITSIPHDWLFRRIDAACHHGGAGTTGASLRAGVPTIIKPFFGDQYFWADRVEALGVGSGVRKLTVEGLTDALLSATTDPKVTERARLLGEQIRAEDGVATAIEAIYRDLDYARSLVKRRQTTASSGDETEQDTIREHRRQPSASPTGPDSSGYSSAGGAASEDWSVISDAEGDTRRSSISRDASGRSSKRNSAFASAVLSVIPDSFKPSSPRKRAASIGSRT